MKRIVPEAIEAYAITATSPVAGLYEHLRQETYADVECPQMQVGPLEGRLLKMLVQLSGAHTAIEIGTFTGYSALSIAEGLPADGKLVALDRNPETAAIAQRYFDRAPWGHKIHLQVGEALESLEALHGPFDFAFIDADKGNYINYYEALLPKMPSGGLLCADNVLWSGDVLDPPRQQSASTKALVAFSRHVAADPRTEQVMLTVRDGVSLVRKL